MNFQERLTVSLIALGAGTLFAWYTIVVDFLRFYKEEGTLFKIYDCLYPNPVTTACFYGGVAFLVSFIVAYKMSKGWKIEHFKKLVLFVFAGTLFGAFNLGLTIQKFYNGEKVSCSGVPADSPFQTPCFFGTVFFLMSLVSLLFAYRAYNK